MTPAPAASGARTGAPLADLPALLRDEPALAQVLGRTSATLAVPESARALVTAGLTGLTQRRPVVLAVPTSTEAERLAHDIGAFLGDDRVELFPAWETLPFERVSPGVETMGRRLRVLWRLRDPERAPDVVVASVRAIVQRLGPHVEDIEPVRITPGQQVDRDDLVSDLVSVGYRREEMVEHRGELAVRGSIVDVFPSTADRPRPHRPVGRRGRPPHRVLGLRPALDRRPGRGAAVPVPRAAAHPRGARAGRAAGRPRAVGPRAVGAPVAGPGVRRHGVVAAVAHPRRARPARRRGRRRPDPAVRAPPHARPGRRPAGRGGRPGRHAGRDVGRHGGTLCRARLPAPAPHLRPPARPHQGQRVARRERARQPRHAPGAGLRVGSGGRRRRRPAVAPRVPAPGRLPGRGGRRRRGLGRPAATSSCGPRASTPRSSSPRSNGGRCSAA